MARGRKRKPTALKVLAGNPGKRALNDSEPTPEAVLPIAPDSLTEVGKSKWDEVALKLYNQGIITELDVDLLELLCINYEEFTEARKMVKTFGGPVVKSDKGNPFQNPYVSIANQCQERMMKIMSLMGMTPVDRQKVKAAPKARKASLAEKFFNAPVVAETVKR